jgi:ABC-type uncharacterized transport system permease subunit
LAELLFWPALLAYGEAAVAYAGNIRRPGVLGRLGTWGVRLGWLVQAALLVVQAVQARGFPWTTWAGSLNLFVWLVVGAYLFWGCRVRYRVLGLAVMPLAAVLFLVAYLGGGVGEARASSYSDLFLVLHVGLLLAGFAGLTLAAGLSAVYLWQERRLKRRETGIFRLGAPALVTLDQLAGRTVAVALVALTVGIAAGVGRLVTGGGHADAVMAVTLLAWGLYGAYLVLRYGGWRGRRAAYLAIAGLALLAVGFGLPVGHLS